MTLREERPSADSCGDPSLEKLLPEKCGAEAVFNFSWEKEIEEFGSGDDDDDDGGGGGGGGRKWTTTVGTTVLLTRTLLSNRTTRSTTEVMAGRPNRTVTRLPPRFTPSLETRYSSFQQLLRLHMNNFNQRLSMLERNTLDVKESIQRMEDQQKHLSSQLVKLVALQSAGEKSKKVKELESSYSDMETRLSRLEGRLEILIDGFTALAQEMNRIKRARHSSRSPQERRALPSITTVLPLLFSQTPRPPVTERPFTRVVTMLKSIPTPALHTNQPSSAAITKATRTSTQLQPSRSQHPTRSSTKATSSPRDRRTHPATVKPRATRPGGRRSTPRKEPGVTKFQLEPPNHKPEAAEPKRASGNRRKKAFRSDAPVVKDPNENDPGGDLKKSEEQHQNPGRKTFTTTKPGTKTRTAAKPKTAAATTSPTTARKHKSTSSKTRKTTAAKTRKTTAPKTRGRAVRKDPATTARRKSAKRPEARRSPVLDLLRLLKGDRKPGKQQKSQDGSLHVVLGRLAIPIKILPDY